MSIHALSLLTPEGRELQQNLGPLRVLGIDLGTTNSTAAEVTWEQGSTPVARCLEVEQPTLEGAYVHVLVPSIVALHQGREFVGEGAKRLRARAAELGLSKDRDLFFECKNEMGLRKTNHRAPEGYRSASDVGGRILDFLRQASTGDSPDPVTRTVVTVPASFRAAQRQDTIRSAALAGLELADGDLLDEPIAAFIDYVISYPERVVRSLRSARSLVVFDFGGGTCDIAVFRLDQPTPTRRLAIAPLAVSRYYRLGGGDIDAAIVHEILIPQLVAQNQLADFELGFEEKKKIIEPVLLGVAESLKIGLCTEIARLESFDKYAVADKSTVVKVQSGVQSCPLGGRQLTLQSPRLTAAEFERVLAPFLEPDVVVPKETEYRRSCSIFAPLEDALERAGMEPDDVDLCLLVGGSSLIPQVADAVEDYFDRATLLTYPDRDSIQTSVARGAAYHALSLALYGSGIVQPVCNDRISIQTEAGPVELIPRGASLPFPTSGGFAECNLLAVPESCTVGNVSVRIEFLAGELANERLLFASVWDVPGPVERGTPLTIEFGYDLNQTFRFRLSLTGSATGRSFDGTIENPLTNVVDAGEARLKIEELEERLRTGDVARSGLGEALRSLAEMYAELKQLEKAFDYLKRALKAEGKPSAMILNQMAMVAGEMGDKEREEKLYREAGEVSTSGIPHFNLALTFKADGRISDAISMVELAIQKDASGPFLVLRAELAALEHDLTTRDRFLERARSAFGPMRSLSDWELHWYGRMCSACGDQDGTQAVAKERKRRSKSEAVTDDGRLPIVRPGMARSDG